MQMRFGRIVHVAPLCPKGPVVRTEVVKRVSSNAKSSSRQAALLGVVDQGVSSLGNVALAVLVARNVSVADFGEFGTAVVVYLVVLGVAKSYLGEVYSLRIREHSGNSDSDGIAPAAVIVGLVTGICIFSVFAITLGPGSAGAIVGLFLPILLLQDTLRYVSFSQHRPIVAIVNDGLWLLLAVAGLAFLTTVDFTIGRAVSVWAVASVPGTLSAFVLLRLRFKGSGVVSWFRAHGRMSSALLIDNTMMLSMSYGTVLVGGFFGSVETVAALRAIQVLIGPLNTLGGGISIALIPRAARRAPEGPTAVMTVLLPTFLGLGGFAAFWGVAITYASDNVGRGILGDSWSMAVDIATLTGVVTALNFLSFPAVATMKIFGLARKVARSRLVIVPIALTCVGFGASEAGASGAVLGMVLGSTLNLVSFWGALWIAWKMMSIAPTDGPD